MNDLSRLFENARDNSVIELEKGRVYHVKPEDSFVKTGYFCSNTAKRHENPKGTRYCAVFLEDKKNITIRGNGAEICVHGKMTPLLFSRCENITVENLSVDYFCPTMTEFKILSNNNGICEFKVNRDCLFDIDGKDLILKGETAENGKPYWQGKTYGQGRFIKIFNPETRLTRDFRRETLEFKKAERISEDTFRAELVYKDADFPVGHIIQSRNIVRDQTGSFFERCRNLEFRNLRMKFMHGLGIVSQFCENVKFENCDFTPGEGRTVASTADFFQFSGCKGKLYLDNIKAWGAHDDYVNVHGTHLRIIRRNKRKKTITVRFMHPESWGFQAFEKGDKLEFIKWNTLEPFGETEVLSYEKLNDTDIRLYLTNLNDNIEVGKDVVENATWTPDLYVRNCNFGTTSGRGILCTTRGEVVIENNVFDSLWGPALLLEDDCNFWFESGYTKKVVFRNNVVRQCEHASMWKGAPVIRYSPKVMDENSAHFVHGELVVTGNTFQKPKEDKHVFYLTYLAKAEITDNIFDTPYTLDTHCVGEIIEENNSICR
ncbi:MAG: hypothetical protein IJ279_06265 [Clostridia bacterium]|nr:hypothetical protein [Clostridia bacterium]